VDTHLLWIYTKDMFSKTTTAQDLRGVGCLIKPVRPVGKPGGLAKSAGSRLQKEKYHRSNQNSTSHTSPLPYG
jgi:hypothetical protein